MAALCGRQQQKNSQQKWNSLGCSAGTEEIKDTNLRWPGGCFADNYHWKDAIGEKSQRKHIENMSWGVVREDNSFGTNEFLDMCEMMNAEPYLAVNMGGGTVQEAADWINFQRYLSLIGYQRSFRSTNFFKY